MFSSNTVERTSHIGFQLYESPIQRISLNVSSAPGDRLLFFFQKSHKIQDIAISVPFATDPGTLALGPGLRSLNTLEISSILFNAIYIQEANISTIPDIVNKHIGSLILDSLTELKNLSIPALEYVVSDILLWRLGSPGVEFSRLSTIRKNFELKDSETEILLLPELTSVGSALGPDITFDLSHNAKLKRVSVPKLKLG